MSQKGFETVIEIKYRDTDSMGHVSSPIYYDYMQHAYLCYMHHLLQLPKSEKLPHIMVRSECDYLKQAMYGETLVVSSAVVKFGTKSFEIEHTMRRQDDTHEVVARAKSYHVMFDYDKQATVPVPQAFKDQVLAFQEG
ncbi:MULTISPECIES: thioesterase family protein [Pseudomonas]|jgi:acyl-CoA thioester hydrolase|uniref:Acyl-CoA thioester hydrolase n=2 Tax=Pseudomonas TaxID=286 RepID=A0A9X8HKK8_PSEPU|nr:MULTISPECIES: acyl-CoA thioesterase [Pseudomonas]KIU52791.1 thioesterase [Pseudomonas putida]KTC23259.1 thioesterase [Pseudomonas putida]MBG8559996.1 acyl-CoA thioesterase [Pseudomonas qingdaonensis]MCO7504038.1 acyl-CoA thioesterase [Pseudomonas sp. VE 267-6A]MCO7530772.1 acyl-CoA thioesterase [Pseudomonas sp. 2]